MAKKAIATVGSMHVCPMVTGLVPHVGGPVAGPGVPGVFIDGQPVAVLGDNCVCVGPPDVIVSGCPGVLVDGKPVALVGSMTAHGGTITMGVPGVTVAGPDVKPAVLPASQIEFPEVSFASMLLSNSAASNAAEKLEEVKELVNREDDKEPRIFNLRWMKGDQLQHSEYLGEELVFRASTVGYDDGETVSVRIYNDAGDLVIDQEAVVRQGEVEIKLSADNGHFAAEMEGEGDGR